MRFVVVAVASSLVLGVSLLVIGWQTSSALNLGLSSVLVAGVPAWSLMIAAVGASAKRKLVYALGLLAFLLVFDLVAFLTGWQDLATQSTVLEGASAGVRVALYRLILIASPLVTLLLFIGGKPSVLWTSAED